MTIRFSQARNEHRRACAWPAAALFVTAGLCASISSAAFAMDEPALGGPKVEERNVPGVKGAFGSEGRGDRRMGDALPPQAVRRAIERVIGEDAPEATRGTPEQIQKIEGIVHEHENAVRSYMQQHREEISQLRREAGPARGPDGERPRRRDGSGEGAGGRQPADDMMTEPSDSPAAGASDKAVDEKREAARLRMREIQAGAPKLEEVMTKVWAELSAEQRAAVDSELDQVRERISRERQDRYVDQRVRERGGEGQPDAGRPGPGPGPRSAAGPRGPGGPGGPPGGPGGALSPERRDRLMRLFEQMSPEQQDQLLQRLEQRAREMGVGDQPQPPRRPGGAAQRGGRGGGPERMGPKPPPSRDEVRPPESIDPN